MRKTLIALVAAVGLSVTLGACERIPTAREIEAQKSVEAANSIKFSANAERENIVNRLNLTADPGKVGYILLLNQSGQPIAYLNVKGKVTSGGKRLMPPNEYYCANGNCGWQPAPSDEGTYGSSNPYVFFWTVDGQYYQWTGDYLYSDKPFRVSIKPLVVEMVEDVKK
jgi:hypothetical protein